MSLNKTPALCELFRIKAPTSLTRNCDWVQENAKTATSVPTADCSKAKIRQYSFPIAAFWDKIVRILFCNGPNFSDWRDFQTINIFSKKINKNPWLSERLCFISIGIFIIFVNETLMFGGHNRKKGFYFLRHRECTTLKRMIHHLQIINWLSYWQIGACSGNCTENVHQVYDTNRKWGPAGDPRKSLIQILFLQGKYNAVISQYSLMCVGSNVLFYKCETMQRYDMVL